MATLEDLTAWRAALEAARFAGVRAVEYQGARTEYRSDAEMQAALADIDRRIAVAEGRPRRRLRRLFVVADKDL